MQQRHYLMLLVVIFTIFAINLVRRGLDFPVTQALPLLGNHEFDLFFDLGLLGLIIFALVRIARMAR